MILTYSELSCGCKTCKNVKYNDTESAMNTRVPLCRSCFLCVASLHNSRKWKSQKGHPIGTQLRSCTWKLWIGKRWGKRWRKRWGKTWEPRVRVKEHFCSYIKVSPKLITKVQRLLLNCSHVMTLTTLIFIPAILTNIAGISMEELGTVY